MKVIVTEFVSLDGVMEAPGGEPGYKHSGWVLAHGMDPEQGKTILMRFSRRRHCSAVS